MNAEQILIALGKVNESYVEEAASHTPQKGSSGWLRWGALAACLCLCMAGLLRLWNPGMGKSLQISSLAVKDKTVYYTVYSKGGYCWSENQKKPKRMLKGDLFVQTANGLFLVSVQKDSLYQVEGTRLKKIGAAGINKALENPVLIDIKDGFAYWKGEGSMGTDDLPKYQIMRTSLETGEAETLITSDGEIRAHTMRGNTLYYEVQADGKKAHRIAVYDVLEKRETDLYEFSTPQPNDGIWEQVYFTKDAVVLQKKDGLYTLPYEGGTPKLLTEQIPITAAFDSYDGKIYFEAAFSVNRNPSEGEGTRESLVCVDLETGKLKELVALTQNGAAAYTYTKICVDQNGYYFTDPQKGLFYHSFADNADVQIVKG